MNTQQFANEVLNEHNAARAKYGNVGGLTLDPSLNNEAQGYANYLASQDSGLVHSQKPNLGENLYMYSSSDGAACTGRDAVKAFIDEVKYYNFNRGDFSMKTGHFTQAVWKGSQRLGVGIAQANSGSWYVVCNYSPAGNVIGQFDQNVFKPGADSGPAYNPDPYGNNNQWNDPNYDPYQNGSKCSPIAFLRRIIQRIFNK